jgi:mannose-6-phosphate isomerase-like protein (cupin superfamily)
MSTKVKNLNVSRYREIEPYVTKDGSIIRELMHPDHHPAARQSLAEAIVAPHRQTRRHKHLESEEIYHIVAGCGKMGMADEEFEVVKGDTVLIPPGVAHYLVNDGVSELRVLCCCSPPYGHDDTELM